MEATGPTVAVTAGHLLDRGVWNTACGMLGISPWAVSDGQMGAGEEVRLTITQATELGLLGTATPPEGKLEVGDVLYGFCGGCFGRDSYDDKRVEAIGADYVVARTDEGHVAFYDGDPGRLREYRQKPDSVNW